MAQNATSPALVPLSVVHQGQRVDIALPAAVPVAELLPGMVAALGRLNSTTATQGYRVVLPSGEELSQTGTLAEQGVSAGHVLTLHRAGEAITDARYDDLAEAIGAAVAEQRTPWRREDSVTLSGFASTGLFGVAALMLVLRGTDDLVTISLGVIGAVLVTLAAAVVQRTGARSGATALALTAPVLLGAAGSAFATGPYTELKAVFAGAGVLLGGLATLVLPARQRSTIAAPLVFGVGITLMGALITYVGVSEQRAAALVLTLAALIVLLTPWLGLAQMPARINALSLTSTARQDAKAVARQVGNADVMVLGLRVGAGLLIVLLTPLVAVTPTGGLLTAAIAIACLLGTRSLHGRAEVLVGAITGMLGAILTGVTLTMHMPGLLPWIIALTIAIGVFVLAINVVSPLLRPWLTRAEDALNIIAIISFLPLTGLIWGIL